MKAIFSSEFCAADEIPSQQIDTLGPVPENWWEQWKERDGYFDEIGRPVQDRYVYPPIEQAFEHGIQK